MRVSGVLDVALVPQNKKPTVASGFFCAARETR